MRLVLIQGDLVALYEGREQLGVWEIDHTTDAEVSFAMLVEELRVSAPA
jgi:hypothetical protein